MIVHTPTLKDYITVSTYFLGIGYIWAEGFTKTVPEKWLRFKENTCVNYHIWNTLNGNTKQLTHCSYNYCAYNSIEVLDVYDFYHKALGFVLRYGLK